MTKAQPILSWQILNTFCLWLRAHPQVTISKVLASDYPLDICQLYLEEGGGSASLYAFHDQLLYLNTYFAMHCMLQRTYNYVCIRKRCSAF